MTKLLHIAIAIAFALGLWYGCSTLPSVCDDMAQGESVLCAIADKTGVHLETAGRLCAAVVWQDVKDGNHTVMEARNIVSHVRYAIGYDQTTNDLYATLMGNVGDNPWFLAASPYIGLLPTPNTELQFLTTRDRMLLNSWLDDIVRYLDLLETGAPGAQVAFEKVN